jgi:hypothetical protein
MAAMLFVSFFHHLEENESRSFFVSYATVQKIPVERSSGTELVRVLVRFGIVKRHTMTSYSW